MSREREEVVAQDQRRNSMWSSTRVRELFRNPALWGDLPYARNLVVKEQRNGQPVVVGRKSNPNAVPVKVPPLIHRTDLERTECQLGGGCERDRYRTGDTLDQLIRGRNKREGGRPWGMEHPLRRRVVCPCGWRMAFRVLRRGEREYLYVACNKQTQLGRAVVDPNASVCGLGQQPVRVLWPMVQALFVQAVQQPDRLIAEAQAQILAEAAAEARSVAKEAQVMERMTEELNDLDAAENRLYKRLDSGLISEAVYRTQTAEIASQRRQLEESKRQLLSRRLIVQKAEGATISLREGLRRAAELRFDDLSLEQWSELLGALVQDVVLDASGMPTLRWRRAA
jgi:hypothetical protein